MNATVTRDMLDEGMHANSDIRPAGFVGGHAGQARGHMLARMLGGSGDIEDNLFTITHNPTNTPQMRDFEQAVYNAAKAGEIVDYNVYLDYANDASKVPNLIQLDARGSGGLDIGTILKNSAGD
jgi:hypothetical protein